jgi:hypothetical protein
MQRLSNRDVVLVWILAGVFHSALAAVVSGLEVQHNPVEPPARVHAQLKELWRVSADDEDEDILLGQIGAAISGPGGQTFVLDSQLSQVLVFDADGSLLRVLGREGEGPGEFRRPTGLFLAGADTLAVMQTFPGRLVFLDLPTGQPLGQWTLGRDDPQAGGFGILQAAKQRGGVRAVSADLNSFDMASGAMNSTQYLALLDREGQERRRLVEQTRSRDLTHQVRDELADHYAGQRGLWDLGPDGRLYCAPRYDSYVILVHAPEGEPLKQIVREHTARIRTEEEKARQRDSINMNVGGRQVSIDWKQQDRARSIEHLQVLDDGSLWIRNSQSDSRWEIHGERTYDVFDSEGRLLREVTVTVPGGGAGHRLLLLDDGRILLVKGMERMALVVGASTTGTTSGTLTTPESSDENIELICYDVLP